MKKTTLIFLIIIICLTSLSAGKFTHKYPRIWYKIKKFQNSLSSFKTQILIHENIFIYMTFISSGKKMWAPLIGACHIGKYDVHNDKLVLKGEYGYNQDGWVTHFVYKGKKVPASRNITIHLKTNMNDKSRLLELENPYQRIQMDISNIKKLFKISGESNCRYIQKLLTYFEGI